MHIYIYIVIYEDYRGNHSIIIDNFQEILFGNSLDVFAWKGEKIIMLPMVLKAHAHRSGNSSENFT